MTHPLQVRTSRAFYDKWARAALEGGASRVQVDSYIDDSIREVQALIAGKCPKCGAPCTREVDKNLNGPSEVPGVWVAYRCSTQPPRGQVRPQGVCDFMLDLKEDVR